MIVVTMPLPPNVANARGHWRKRYRAQMRYREDVASWMLAKLIPTPPPEPIERAEVSATLFVWSERDDDNAVASLKWPLDELVRLGFLADDSRKHVRLRMPDQVVDRKRQRLEVAIHPRTEGEP